MPLFLHIHEAVGITAEAARAAHLQDVAVARGRDVVYRRYWVDPGAGKFFCLVEAPTAASADIVHAEGHGMLAAEVYEVREGPRDRKDYEDMCVLLAGALAPDSNCVDVGCSQGVVLRAMQRCAPRGRHIAFEPVPELYGQLVTMFPQVDIRNVALANQPGTRSFVHLPEQIGYSHFPREADSELPPSGQLITVQADTLDGALPEGYVPAVVKIDVEGAELEVLQGAELTLTACRPIVIFEHGAGRPEVSEQIFELVCHKAGLRIYDIDGRGPMIRQRFLDVVREAQVWNFVARP